MELFSFRGRGGLEQADELSSFFAGQTADPRRLQRARGGANRGHQLRHLTRRGRLVIAIGHGQEQGPELRFLGEPADEGS